MEVIKRNKLAIDKLRVCKVKKIATSLDDRTIAISVDRAVKELDFNDQEINLENALKVSLSWEDLEMTKLFIDLGGEVNARGEWGTTPLHLATMYQDVDFIKYLVSQGSEIDAVDVSLNSPLHRLIDHRTSTEIVELFLDFHPIVNVQNSIGEIPLCYAVRENNLEVAELLINRGSDVNNRNVQTGESLLHLASRSLNKKMIKLLLRNGAKIDALDFKNRTPLVCALKSGRESTMVKKLDKTIRCLLKNYASVNILASKDKHVLRYAKLKCSQEIILEHLAKLKVRKLPIHPSLLETISNCDEFNDYFTACTEELLVAKTSTLVSNSWITYFDLVVGNERQLKNYAENKDLIEDFDRRRKIRNKKFPIYGAQMQENVQKGIYRRTLFNESAKALSQCIPGFQPSDLITKKVLDCFTNKDLQKMKLQKLN